MLSFFLSLLGAAMIAANGLARVGEPVSAATPGCALEIEERAQAIMVRAVIEGAEPARGTFEMTLHRRGSGGAIDMSQDGGFDLDGGERLVVGEAVLNGSARELVAAFTLHVEDQAFRCPVVIDRTFGQPARR